MKNDSVRLIEVYVKLIKDSKTDEYKWRQVWWLDRHRPDIADKVRAKLPDELRNLVKTYDPETNRPAR